MAGWLKRRCTRLVSLARPDAPSMGIMVRPPWEKIPDAATGYESSWLRCHDGTAWTRTKRPNAERPSRDGASQSVCWPGRYQARRYAPREAARGLTPSRAANEGLGG